MITVKHNVVWSSTQQLDRIARGVLGSATAGVSTADYSAIVLVDETDATIATASAILAGENKITSITTSPEQPDDETAVMITCNDTSIASDDMIGFAVFIDGELYDEGVVDVVDGVATLNDPTPDAGLYDIVFYRLVDDYVSGSAQMTVTEVI